MKDRSEQVIAGRRPECFFVLFLILFLLESVVLNLQRKNIIFYVFDGAMETRITAWRHNWAAHVKVAACF